MSLPQLVGMIPVLCIMIVLALGSWIFWRDVGKRFVQKQKARWLIWSWPGAGVGMMVFFACARFSFNSWTVLVFLFLWLWAASVFCFKIMTSSKLRFPLLASWIAGNINSVASILLLIAFHRQLDHGFRSLSSLLPLSLAAALAGTAIMVVFAYLVRISISENAQRVTETGGPAMEQDRDLIIKMLREEKVSGQEAAELLKALGTQKAPADRLPMLPSVRGAIVGAILVVVGFMLPWSYVRIPMPLGGGVEGYQAGYNIGFLGWAILVVGILPAIMACIPALDKHLRQGLLRMVIACIGGAFVLTMLVRSPNGIGLWIAAIGFGFQLVTAFAQAGFTASQPQQ